MPTATRVRLGTRLRSARLDAGVSAEHAAIHVGRSAYTINGYELGKIEPPLHVAAAMAALYGTSVDALLDERVVA